MKVTLTGAGRLRAWDQSIRKHLAGKRLDRSRIKPAKSAQTFAQRAWIAAGNKLLHSSCMRSQTGSAFSMRLWPFRSKRHDTAAAVHGVLCDFDQPAAFKRFQCGRQRGAIHGEQVGHRTHGRAAQGD